MSQNSNFKPKDPVSPEKLLEGLGESNGIITKPLGRGTGQVEINNFEALSSYSWIEANEPTIAIPGMAPSFMAQRLN